LLLKHERTAGQKTQPHLHWNKTGRFFAVPGRIYSAASAGANSLIAQQHAKLVCSAENILEELSLMSLVPNQQQFKFE